MSYGEDCRAFMEFCMTHRLTGTERLLWHRIRWLFDRHGNPKRLAIGTGQLADLEEISRDTVERARRTLVRAGLIRHSESRGRVCTEYELLPFNMATNAAVNTETNAALNAAVNTESNAALNAEETDVCADACGEINNINNNNPTLLEDKGVRGKRDRVSRRQEPREDLFERFWAAYPRKVGKKPCLEAWKRLRMTDELFGRIMARLESDKKSRQWSKDDGQFIPHPATWTRQARWEDVDETQALADLIGPQEMPQDGVSVDGRRYY